MDSPLADAQSAWSACDETQLVVSREFFESIAHARPGMVEECVRPFGYGTERQIGFAAAADTSLARALSEWVCSFESPRDREYLESRRAVGRRHCAVGIPRELVIASLGRLREQLFARVMAWPESLERRRCASVAINRELDLELALVLGGYIEFEQRKLTTDEHLSAIARLSVSIGHELRNPLGTIETSAYLIAQRLARLEIADEGIDRHVEKVRKHVQLCSRIISDLLEFARTGKPARQQVRVEPVIDDALDAITWPPGIQRNKSVMDGLTIFADREQLRSVLVNLFENARDAMQQSGTLEVTARDSDAGVVFRISNDGPGIAPEDQNRLFEPFYTKKAGGNGLGLALCHRIVAAHGGTLELEPNQIGVTFRVWFPAERESTRERGTEP